MTVSWFKIQVSPDHDVNEQNTIKKFWCNFFKPWHVTAIYHGNILFTWQQIIPSYCTTQHTCDGENDQINVTCKYQWLVDNVKYFPWSRELLSWVARIPRWWVWFLHSPAVFLFHVVLRVLAVWLLNKKTGPVVLPYRQIKLVLIPVFQHQKSLRLLGWY